ADRYWGGQRSSKRPTMTGPSRGASRPPHPPRRSMALAEQLQRLLDLGLPEVARVSPAELAGWVDDLDEWPDSVLMIHPDLVAPSALAPLLSRRGKQGFVVQDMTDLDEFGPTPDIVIPDRPLYVATGIDRGDDMANWS